jgi:hypothetical protein
MAALVLVNAEYNEYPKEKSTFQKDVLCMKYNEEEHIIQEAANEDEMVHRYLQPNSRCPYFDHNGSQCIGKLTDHKVAAGTRQILRCSHCAEFVLGKSM